jgi:hypothetical protein
VILITRWPHFRNIYKSGMVESRERKMEIPEPYEVVLAFLKYLYNDQLDENESCEIICEVLVLANMYLLHRLKKICCQKLYKQHLSIQNCGTIFEKAMMAEEVGLKLLTLDFMFKNYGQVLKSNILLQMSTAVRNEFLEAVPDDAILDVHSSNQYYYYQKNSSKKTGDSNSSSGVDGGVDGGGGGSGGGGSKYSGAGGLNQLSQKNYTSPSTLYSFDLQRLRNNAAGNSSTSGGSSSAASSTTVV